MYTPAAANDTVHRQESIRIHATLEMVKQRMEEVRESRNKIATDLRGLGFDLSADSHLVPIYSHRYVVCTSNPGRSEVLSIVVNDVDAIVYGNSLREYLEREFLGDS
jgi:hypothetical protein